ncbi:uncharacterized protein PADG_07132 [Paracoccidioides brasiliensis Pb18]|uniref:Uncharacterized protein n=1 Tax=Paracoccidioides brasiliensis (strain Pb18) TaxID=502780 RepID=C1GIP6_PARBD|nr:uncharacterized protein PADG_07132 [Paracoccidioides brasiliensis Pb18]EEH42312.2 hypothetical protein PADG_07132 [Paracoccidioides brasiliensis Pb18]ODH51748.1 hypothetical protein GX48_01990 [Paracoccidioides brasiliensis]
MKKGFPSSWAGNLDPIRGQDNALGMQRPSGEYVKKKYREGIGEKIAPDASGNQKKKKLNDEEKREC